jgi:hypothetical protein
MNLLGRLVALFVILALAGCARGPTSQGPTPYAPYSIAARTCVAAVMAAGVVEAAVACSGQSVRKSTGTPPRAERARALVIRPIRQHAAEAALEAAPTH